MITQKRSLMVVSLCLAFIVWGALFPTLTIGSVQVGTADFAEVAVSSTSTIPLYITNTGSSTLILYFQYENYTCNFSLPRQKLVLQPAATVDVEIHWTPVEGPEGTTCSDTLKVFYGGDLPESVLVTGTAVEAGQAARNPTSKIVIGEYATGVVDRKYQGKFISDLITECATDQTNHGQFVSCGAGLVNELKEAEVISDKEKGALQSSAAKAKLTP